MVKSQALHDIRTSVLVGHIVSDWLNYVGVSEGLLMWGL